MPANDSLIQRARDLQSAGRFVEAADVYQQILLADPMQFEPFYSLAMIAVQTGQLEEAQLLLNNAMKLQPGFAEGWYARGLVLLQLKRPREAMECFDRALAIRPEYAEALSSRATAFLELGQLDAAIADFDRALVLDSTQAISWNNRGNALAQTGRLEEAISSYDKALALVPFLPQALENRDSAMFQLKRAGLCPPGYMRHLFDDFAPTYDQTMLHKLGYAAHLHLRALADAVLPKGAGPWRILDLGCGTGLVGEAFKDLGAGGRLDGIDIAPRMIEAARARGLYDELILGDLEVLLPAPGPSYSLILAADTMIYVGDLEPTFRGVARRLDPGGFYLFAVESKDGEGWEQTPMNRFAHSESYLRRLAGQTGLDVVDIKPCKLRNEGVTPVEGFAVALRAPSGGVRSGLATD
jgi:predicted TPR repeat methyltransferase